MSEVMAEGQRVVETLTITNSLWCSRISTWNSQYSAKAIFGRNLLLLTLSSHRREMENTQAFRTNELQWLAVFGVIWFDVSKYLWYVCVCFACLVSSMRGRGMHDTTVCLKCYNPCCISQQQPTFIPLANFAPQKSIRINASQSKHGSHWRQSYCPKTKYSSLSYIVKKNGKMKSCES